MEFRSFRHPNFFLPPLRSQSAQNFLAILGGVGSVAMSRGKRVSWGGCFPSEASLRSTVRRLIESGLIREKEDRGGEKTIDLSDAGKARLPEYFRSEFPWRKSWNGTWFILISDLPPKAGRRQRLVRDFVETSRMGCLRKGVWISSRDIRSAYAALSRSTGIDKWTYVLEVSAVAGRGAQDVVDRAWGIARLEEKQVWYNNVCTENLRRLITQQWTQKTLLELASEESSAFTEAMRGDPLLPQILWPSGYQGEKAFRLHREITREIGLRL